MKNVLNKSGYPYLQKIYKPKIFKLSEEHDLIEVQKLKADHPSLQIFDTFAEQVKELIKLQHPSQQLSQVELQRYTDEYINNDDPDYAGVWVYYPWSERFVHLLDKEDFIAVRTNRNKNKITLEEQQTLRKKRAGVIGLSVGQSVALTMAMERICGEIRIADFDTLDLSNLNRIRAGIHNINLPKVLIVAREIAEIDPFIKVKIYPDGISEENITDFLLDEGGLDILIDECDSIDIKILCRLKAKAHSIPVVMDTSDRGMLDIERFDLEKDRPLFHGLLADLMHNIDLKQINTMSRLEKIPLAKAIAGGENLSDRAKTSMKEIGKTITTWPQLASSVVMGGAVCTDICRRILLDQLHISGRYYIDIDKLIAD